MHHKVLTLILPIFSERDMLDLFQAKQLQQQKVYYSKVSIWSEMFILRPQQPVVAKATRVSVDQQ